MTRTQIYLSERQMRAIRSLAVRGGLKQSEVIRRALDEYLDAQRESHRSAATKAACGMWKDRTDLPDFRELRRGWDRGRAR